MYTANITSRDAAGNTSTATNVSFTVDTVAPVVPSYTVSPNPTSGNVVITLSVVESGASTSIA